MNWNKFVRFFYYLIKRLINAIIAFVENLFFTPTSFLKGQDFEKCLRKKVFPDYKYDLVMKTHDYRENKNDYVEASLHPDYLFRDKETGTEFWVEAKYREKLYKGKVEWCKPYQLKRYKKLAQEENVIIAIGFGGRPDNPDRVFLVPLEEINYTGLYPNKLIKYEFTGGRKNIVDGLLDKVYNYRT